MVGKNIRKIRVLKGLTQEELAEKLGVTRQALSDWERDKTQPDVDTLQKMSQILEVTVEEILYGFETKSAIRFDGQNVKRTVKEGVSLGTVIAVVISYVKWKSIGWAILHGLMSWIYVIYFAIVHR